MVQKTGYAANYFMLIATVLSSTKVLFKSHYWDGKILVSDHKIKPKSKSQGTKIGLPILHDGLLTPGLPAGPMGHPFCPQTTPSR